MGTTAQKLTYLNDTKRLLKDSINNLGGSITSSTTFRNYATELDSIYAKLPKVSGKGTAINLTPTLKSRINSELYGDTSQNGTPTPSSPVPIECVTGLQNVTICGKNLLPYPYFSGTTTINGITFTPQDDGSVFVKGTATGQATFSLYGNYEEINQKPLTGNYISGGSSNVKIRVLNHTGSSYTGLGTDTGNGVQIDKTTYNTGYIELLVSNGTNLQNGVYVKPMMLNNLDDTTYEPYTGNTYEVNLGKQLFDYSKINYIANGTHNSGVITQTGQNCYFVFSNDPISVNSGDTIYFSADIKLNDNSTGTFGNLNDNVNGGTTKILQPTLSTTYQKYQTSFKYNSSTKIDRMLVQILNLSGSAEVKNIMISKSNSTSYSPYFTPIELNKISTYEDSIKKSTGKNLFDKNNVNVLNAYIDGSIVSGANHRTIYISCEPNTTYTIQKINKGSNKRFRVATTENTPVLGSEILQDSGNYPNNDSITITTLSNSHYLCVWCYVTNDTEVTWQQILDSIMINEGTALPYEPYGKVWYIQKNIGKVVLDGTESNIGINQRTNGYQFDFANSLGMNGNSDEVLMLSQNFRGIKFNDRNNYNESIYSWSNDNRIRILTNVATTVNDFKAWLSSHNTEVLFILATPTYTVITNTELIEDLENLYKAIGYDNQTNISSNGSLPVVISASMIKGAV